MRIGSNGRMFCCKKPGKVIGKEAKRERLDDLPMLVSSRFYVWLLGKCTMSIRKEINMGYRMPTKLWFVVEFN